MKEQQPPNPAPDAKKPAKTEELHTTKPETLAPPTNVHEASKAGKGLE